MTSTDETDDLLRKLKPLMGRRTKALWYFNLLAKDSKAAQRNRDFLKLIADRTSKIDYEEQIRLPPPSPELLEGEYHIGTVVYPDARYAEFGLREQELIKHILAVGMTGAGKTNLMYHLLRQLAQNNKPFLVFDWKQNYRALKQFPEFQDLRIIRVGSEKDNLIFNPLIPPQGVKPKHWMTMLVDVIKHAFFVAHGVEFFFRKGIDHLYKQFGIYKGQQEYPTFEDLEKVLQKEFVRGREMLWMSSAKRVLASLTFSGLLGESLNVRQQPSLNELLNKPLILELDNLATIEKIFLVEALLLWIYHLRKNQPQRERFQHAIVIEEAHHILSGRKEFQSGEETIIETLIRMIREFGESVIVIDQEPSKLSNSILANTNCKICFNLGNGKDMITMARSMNLTSQEMRYIDKLKVGEAIVKMKERFTEPVHVKVPLVPIKKENMSVGSP